MTHAPFKLGDQVVYWPAHYNEPSGGIKDPVFGTISAVAEGRESFEVNWGKHGTTWATADILRPAYVAVRPGDQVVNLIPMPGHPIGSLLTVKEVFGDKDSAGEFSFERALYRKVLGRWARSNFRLATDADRYPGDQNRPEPMIINVVVSGPAGSRKTRLAEDFFKEMFKACGLPKTSPVLPDFSLEGSHYVGTFLGEQIYCTTTNEPANLKFVVKPLKVGDKIRNKTANIRTVGELIAIRGEWAVVDFCGKPAVEPLDNYERA